MQLLCDLCCESQKHRKQKKEALECFSKLWTSQTIPMNGCITGEQLCHGIMWHQPVRTSHSAAAVPLSCRYWRLNDPFPCTHCSREFQRFSIGWTNLKIHHSYGGIMTSIYHMVPWAHKSQAPKWHLNRSSCFCTAHPCAQHTQTDTWMLCVTSVTTTASQAVHPMWPKITSFSLKLKATYTPHSSLIYGIEIGPTKVKLKL